MQLFNIAGLVKVKNPPFMFNALLHLIVELFDTVMSPNEMKI